MRIHFINIELELHSFKVTGNSELNGNRRKRDCLNTVKRSKEQSINSIHEYKKSPSTKMTRYSVSGQGPPGHPAASPTGRQYNGL